MSVNLHGTITTDNYDEAREATLRYKPHRLEVAGVLGSILKKLGYEYFIEGGTLMGAYRNHRMLEHDDDFDYGIICPDESRKKEFLEKLHQEISRELPEGIKARIVMSYSNKIEVYKPEQGKYDFLDTDYHNATVDLTLFAEYDDTYYLLHSKCAHLRFPKETLLPLSEIEYEGCLYPSPFDPKGFLEAYYGYIGPNAIFDKETGYYKPNES